MTFQLDADGADAHDEDAADRYADGILSHSLPTELRRLRVMEQMLDPDEISVLGGLGIQSSWHCLELGAGAGSIARWLAERCPEGRVVATDLDTSFLEDGPPSGLEIVRHDVRSGDFPPGSFDVIHARALFMHLPDRDAVLRRVAAWLKPGGWLVVSDADMFTVDSTPHPAMHTMWAAVERLFTAQGSDPRWARRLSVELRRAGLADIGMSVTVDTFGGGGVTDEFWRSSIAQVRPFLMEQGLVSEAVYAEAQALLDDPDFRDTLWAYIRCWGRRPPG
ncbi:methyltransferase domain-containing protein [Actinoplanes sp. NPDC049802]|uniref:methyltransferase domain-containing protein n=1 Tax=Actinoplanes sp. NPDC049802 TaxID=3154742 RepID=UPI0033E85999